MIRTAPLIRSLVDLVYPPRCGLCQSHLSASQERFCPDCLARFGAERAEDACPTCAAQVAPFEVRQDQCRRCRELSLHVLGTVRAGPYGAAHGQLLRDYKFHGREELEPILGEWLSNAVAAAPWFERIEAVVSVPTHWLRRLSRPHHAADRLAAFCASRIERPYLPMLRRTRAGPHQLGLSYTERAENVRGAFALREGVGIRQARLLLIDDVRTTGATIEECAKVLRRAGTSEIYAAVVVSVGWARPGVALTNV